MRFLLLFMLVFFSIPPGAFAQTFTGKLVKVVDGDTVHVLKNGKAEKIRLADIDCPERKQPFGQVAKRFVLDLAAQKIVKVDVKTTDRYGRKIASIYLPDGRNLNYAIVEAGLAWQYRKYSKDQQLKRLESEARIARLGLWADPDPVPPWSWRKAKRK